MSSAFIEHCLALKKRRKSLQHWAFCNISVFQAMNSKYIFPSFQVRICKAGVEFNFANQSSNFRGPRVARVAGCAGVRVVRPGSILWVRFRYLTKRLCGGTINTRTVGASSIEEVVCCKLFAM